MILKKKLYNPGKYFLKQKNFQHIHFFKELATPKAESPDCGFLIPNVDLSPLCSPKFRPGPPSEEAQCATKLVDRILFNSGAVDLKDLCIHKDKLAWVLYCDIVCVDYDGAVIDACIGALMAALKSCKSYINFCFQDAFKSKIFKVIAFLSTFQKLLFA